MVAKTCLHHQSTLFLSLTASGYLKIPRELNSILKTKEMLEVEKDLHRPSLATISKSG